MQRPAQDSNANFEMSLRDQLIAAQAGNPPPSEPRTSLHPPPPAPNAAPPPYTDPGSSGARDQQLDPPMSEEDHQQLEMNMANGMDLNEALAAMNNASRAGRRELSSSKRAAQNRAAQRAFRQRKEAYITKLEKQVKDYRIMEEDFKTLQQENYQLREYILSLQGRLLETSSDLPPPPPQVSLQEPNADRGMRAHAQMQTQSTAQPEDQLKSEMLAGGPAPVASMAGRTEESAPMAAAAVEQLQAAAAEAGNLESPSAPKAGS